MRMKTKIREGDSVRTKAAADFVARLYSGDMSDTEAAQIENWLAADDANRREFEQVLQTWDDLEGISSRQDIMSIAEPGGALKSRRRWLASVGLAAAATVVVGLLVVFLNDAALLDRIGLVPETYYVTQVGERRSVTLSDGSKVTLNTNSKIRVDYRRDVRNITLEYGEAFFDIEKDPDRPLQLVAGSSLVTVLGTKFNVHWSGPDVTIAVVEGLVAVRPVSIDSGQAGQGVAANEQAVPLRGEVLLESGSAAVFSEKLGSVDKNYTVHTDDVQNWRFGYVRFDNDPLYKVIGEVNRYSTKKISIEDKDIMELPISGIFSLDDVDKILTGLEAVFPIVVTRRFDGYTIVAAETVDSP